MCSKGFIILAILVGISMFGVATAYAQTSALNTSVTVTQENNIAADNALIGNAAFKEWLLADTNAHISRWGMVTLAAFVVSCLLFLAALGMVLWCCRKHAGGKCLFDEAKLRNCQSHGHFGMFIYDFGKERIQTTGPVFALFDIKGDGALSKDAYLRLMHHGQNLPVDYEPCFNTELVYEREPDVIFINLYIFPILDKQGRLRGEYGILQDVSVYRRRELNYRMRRDAAKETFDSVDAYLVANPMHAMVLHDSFDILRMNKAAINIVGEDENEFYSMSFESLLTNNEMIDAFARHLWQAEEAGFAVGTFELLNQEHRAVDVEIYTSKLRTTDHGDILCSSLRTVS